jgi:hypothetical protein
MKTIISIISSIMLILLLSACGTQTTTEKEVKQTTNEKKVKQITKEDVVNKAFANTMTSFEADTKTTVNLGVNEQKSHETLAFSMKFIQEPFISHFKVTTVDGSTEFYFDQESAYALTPGQNGWIKAPTNNLKELENLASGKSIKEDLERLKNFVDVFQLYPIVGGYDLKVALDESSSEREKELAMTFIKESLNNPSFEVVGINKFYYNLVLDNNYLIKQVKAEADLNVNIDGEAGKANIFIDGNYKNVNSLEPFSIPDDVKQNAKQI